MIDGIEIIEKTAVTDMTILVPLLVLAAMISFGFLILKGKLRFIGITLILLIIDWLGVAYNTPPFALENGRYAYKCILDDDITVGYLKDHYTNIEYYDGVWTFEDKE